MPYIDYHTVPVFLTTDEDVDFNQPNYEDSGKIL